MESRSDGRKEKPPDGRAPRGRERRGGWGGEAGRAAVWAGKVKLGRGEGIGPAGLGCAGRKGKKKMGWAENGLEGRVKFLLFFSF